MYSILKDLMEYVLTIIICVLEEVQCLGMQWHTIDKLQAKVCTLRCIVSCNYFGILELSTVASAPRANNLRGLVSLDF